MADGGALVRTYPRAEIDTWPKNPRTSALDVTDILATLLTNGKRIPGRTITEPLRLRLEPSGRYTALKGARRLMAAAIAGIDELPGIEVTWTDEEALDEALIDEARKALTPLEEAAALAGLRTRGLDVPAIAARAGRTERHVHKRLALIDALVDEGKALLAARRLTLPLAEHLAALGPDVQKKVAADIARRFAADEAVNVREVEYLIRGARLRLRDGGFPLDDPALVPAAGTCVACPKRSGAQAALFLDGVEEDDLCSDEKCFKSKKTALLVRLKTKARASGVRVVDAPAEKKKLFPYGSSLSHDSAFVDLDASCDLVRPPTSAPTKSQGRKGGPATCQGDGQGDAPEGGKHDFDQGVEYSAADYEDGLTVGDDAEAGCREAFEAGCAAWVVCDNGCGAWEELDPRPGAAPRGWKPPTWRQAIGQALASFAAPDAEVTVKPDLVAEDNAGGAHELADKKAVVKLLRDAKLVDERAAQNEIRDVKPAKKPGELDKWELDKWELERKAKAAAHGVAVEAVVAKAVKKAADVKFWRFLAGLILRHAMEPLEEVATRRGLEVKESKGNDAEEKALLAWIAEQKEEGPLRGLVVELFIADEHGGDHDAAPLTVASRFYGVDVAALQKEAAVRIKAEAKQKAKEKEAKAAKKGAKKTTKPKATPAPQVEQPAPEPRRPSRFGGSTMVGKPSQEWIDAFKGAKEAAPGACQSCGCTEDNACVGGCAWADTEGTICTRCAELGEQVIEHLETSPPAGTSVEDLCDILDGVFGEEDWYTPKHRDGALRVLAARGRIVLRGDRYVVPEQPADPGPPPAEPPGPRTVACPLTQAHVDELLRELKIKDAHAGAVNPSSVWSMARKLFDAIDEAHPVEVSRTALHKLSESAGTHCVDVALHYLTKGSALEEWGITHGKAYEYKLGACALHSGKGPLPLPDPAKVFAPAETVQLAGDARKAAEVRACSKCSAKSAKPCVGARGKLGAGWFHAERAQTFPPPKAPPTSSPTRTCRRCGCNDDASCQDDHPTSELGECTWTESNLCSVCARCGDAALRICQKEQSRTALTKALTTAKGKGIETFNPARAKATIADLEKSGALAESKPGKLLASQAVAE